MYAKNLICRECKSAFSTDEPIWQCKKCGSLLNVVYDYKKLEREIRKEILQKRPTNLWRFEEFLPLKKDVRPVSLGEGFTPIVSSSFYERKLGVNLFFKLEFLNPTGSFKDRGTAVMVSKIKELGIKRIADDSSGNAGSSLACYAAREGIDCTIYTPQHAASGKLHQIQMHGAKLRTVPGFRHQVTQRIKEDCGSDKDLYYASHNLNPFFLEGTKTLALETSEQLNWQVPDHILFPVGGGGLIIGAFKGFKELYKLGWIKRIPKLHGIQSKACPPIVKSLAGNLEEVPAIKIRETIAEGIHIKKPERSKEILESIRESEGSAVAVTESNILKYYREIARKEGIFCEPTSAVSLAGLAKLLKRGTIKPDETVLLPITGFGLKDPKSSRKAIPG